MERTVLYTNEAAFQNAIDEYAEKKQIQSKIKDEVKKLLNIKIKSDFFDDIIDLKREFSNKALFHMTLNILRFPSFQSVTLLPDYIKEERIEHLTMWLEAFGSFLTDSEKAHIQRLITYLEMIFLNLEEIQLGCRN